MLWPHCDKTLALPLVPNDVAKLGSNTARPCFTLFGGLKSAWVCGLKSAWMCGLKSAWMYCVNLALRSAICHSALNIVERRGGFVGSATLCAVLDVMAFWLLKNPGQRLTA
jgi:hypothetical protein